MPGKKGSIWVLCGCMFAQKTSRLQDLVRRAEIARLNWISFKPFIEQRYSPDRIVSHDGRQMNAIVIQRAEEILAYIREDTQVVAIDEAQFLNDEIINVVITLASRGIQVYIAGLDTDFRGLPFGPIPGLLAIAQRVEKLTAICTLCGEEATRTIRLPQNEGGVNDEETIIVGGKEVYEPRCLECFLKAR
ncbi:thymidine kinase [candidate division WWE3 bacterium]|nr:thymidine kinase [candidate division WWE3 bacterium]